MKKRLEDYTWDELIDATSTKESQKEAGRDSGQYTLEKSLGIHTEDEELRKEWAKMGGEANIDTLLQWQKDNNWNVGKLPKTEEWKNNISKSHMGKKLSADTKKKISEYNKNLANSMTDEERVNRYGNDASKRRGYNNRKRVYDALPNDEFTSMEFKKVVVDMGFDVSSWKLMAKDERFFIRIHKGTNQTNPSIFKKVSQ